MNNKFSPILFVDIFLTIGIVLSNYLQISFFSKIFVAVSILTVSFLAYKSDYKGKGVIAVFALLFIYTGLILPTSNITNVAGKLLNNESVKGTLNIVDGGIYRNFRYFYIGSLNKVKSYNTSINFKKRKMYIYSPVQISIPSEIEFVGTFKVKRGIDYINIRKILKSKPVTDKRRRFRQVLIQRVNRRFLTPSRALTSATLLGNRRALGYEVKRNFKRAGLLHLLAISGLHIAILFLVFRIFLFWMKPVSRFWRDFLALLLLFSYVSIIGFPPSAVRAFIMIAVLVITFYLNKVYNPLNSLAVAYFIFIIISPDIIYSTGFQLSFVATLSIILFVEPVNKYVHSSLISITISAQILVLPLVAFYFKYIPTLFIVGNVVLVPFFSIILGISVFILAISFLNIGILYHLLNIIDIIFLKSMAFVSAFSFSAVPVVKAGSLFIILYYLGILMLKLQKKKSVALVIIGISFLSFLLPANKKDITFFNQRSPFLTLYSGNKQILLDLGTGKYIDSMINYAKNYLPTATVITCNANVYSVLNAIRYKGKIFYSKKKSYRAKNIFIENRRNYTIFKKDNVLIYFFKKKGAIHFFKAQRNILVVLGSAKPQDIDGFDVTVYSKSYLGRRRGNNGIELNGLDMIFNIKGINFKIEERKIWQNLL